MNYIFFPIKIKILLILLSISTTVTEIFGIGVFIPILQYMKEQGDLNALTSTSDLWQYVVNVFNWMGVEVSLSVLLLVAFFSFVVRQFLAYLRIVYRVNAVENLAKKIRTILFNRYLDADYNLYQKLNTGGLLNIITKESSQAVLGAMAPLDLFAALIMTLGYLSAMFFLSWEMTLIAVVVLVLSGLTPSRWIRQSTKTGRDLVKSNSYMSDFLVERFKSALLVRLSGTKAAEKKEFSKINFVLSRQNALKIILRGRTNAILEPIIIGFSLMLLYLSYTTLNLSIEVIGVYMLIVMRLIPVTKLIVSQFQTIKTVLGSVELINKKIREMVDSKEVDDGNKDLINFNSIEFKNVSFKFKTRKKNTLNNISFEILSGEKVAIVGPSGSG